MELIFVSRFAWPSIGGTEAVVTHIASAMQDGGAAVRVFAHRVDSDGVTWHGPLDRVPRFPRQVDPATGVSTEQLRLRWGEALVLRVAGIRGGPRFEWLHERLSSRRFADQFAPADLIHRFGGNRIALATVQAAKRLNVPAVVTPFAHPGQWDADEISASAYRDADLVVATSRADAAVYERLGVPTDRIGICPLPTGAPALGGGRKLLADLGIDGPVVLYLGGRRDYKGVEELLKAAEILAPDAPDVRFAFVGPGPALAGAGAGANVFDVGAVTDAQRDAWLDAADVLCLPSSAESFGLAISERWSAGVQVVTSDIPVLRERVTESGGGIVSGREPAALAHAVRSLIDDTQLRRQMGQAGHEHWQRT